MNKSYLVSDSDTLRNLYLRADSTPAHLIPGTYKMYVLYVLHILLIFERPNMPSYIPYFLEPVQVTKNIPVSLLWHVISIFSRKRDAMEYSGSRIFLLVAEYVPVNLPKFPAL